MQEVGWFDQEENSSGAIAARLSTDTLYIRGAVGDQLGLIIQTLVTIIAAYVIAFTASWKMTLVITATVPLLGTGAWINAKFMLGFSSKVCACCPFALENRTVPFGHCGGGISTQKHPGACCSGV